MLLRFKEIMGFESEGRPGCKCSGEASAEEKSNICTAMYRDSQNK